MTQVWQVYKI